MRPTAAVEVEVAVPCVEGQHTIRLRIVSWERWEVAYTPCEDLSGSHSLMVPCSHYVRENRDALKVEVVRQLAQAGASAVPALIEALGDRDAYVRRAAAAALGRIGDAQAVPALEKLLSDDYMDWLTGRYPVREAAQQALEQIRAKQQLR